MKKLLLKNGLVVFENESKVASVECSDGKITNIFWENEYKNNEDDYTIIDCTGKYIMPGFIDIHVHGGGGADSATATVEAYKTIAKNQLRFGTTSFVIAVPGGLPDENIHNCLEVVKHIKANTTGANILGVHLEGPFINPKKRAAIPKENLCDPSIEKLYSVMGDYEDLFKIVTLAPELLNIEEVITELKRKNIIAAMGHSEASYTDTIKAISYGANHFTHAFNAMTLMSSREPGMIVPALVDDNCYVELIADGYHVDKENIKLALRIKNLDKVCLITDAIEVVGTDATSFSLPGLDNIQIRDGRTWGPNGAIIGSILTQNVAVKNISQWTDLPIHSVVKMATGNPAKELGIYPQKGIIKAGSDADIIVADKELNVLNTIVNGEVLYSV